MNEARNPTDDTEKALVEIVAAAAEIVVVLADLLEGLADKERMAEIVRSRSS
jgi:hypothetical protein